MGPPIPLQRYSQRSLALFREVFHSSRRIGPFVCLAITGDVIVAIAPVRVFSGGRGWVEKVADRFL